MEEEMKIYTFRVKISERHIVEVKAKSLEKAKKMLDEDPFDYVDSIKKTFRGIGNYTYEDGDVEQMECIDIGDIN
jgi:hypothetical protein